MIAKRLAVSAALLLLAGAVYAGPACQGKSPGCGVKSDAQRSKAAEAKAGKAKYTEVKVCPMMGGKVTGKGAGTAIHGKYRVYFCCAGCKPAWNALTKAEKDKKLAIALKKQGNKS